MPWFPSERMKLDTTFERYCGIPGVFIHSSYIMVSFYDKAHTYICVYTNISAGRNIVIHKNMHAFLCVCLQLWTHIYAYTHIGIFS